MNLLRLVMERSGLTMWPVLSFVIFLVSCGLMLLWLFRPGSGPFYGSLSRMALGEPDKMDGNGNEDSILQGRN